MTKQSEWQPSNNAEKSSKRYINLQIDAQIIETELKRDRFWAEGTAGIADRDVGGFVCANKIFQEADSYMI